MKKLFNKTRLLAAGICAFMFLFSYAVRINLGIPYFLILLYICFYKKFTKIKLSNINAIASLPI